MEVTRDQLERCLARLREAASDPAQGIYGPDSPAWVYKREAINFLGGARAALLQLAHPYVAAAIDQKSQTRADIQGRFRRTFDNVFAMTFGDLATAFRAARAVHAVHTRIVGRLDHDVGRFAAGTRYAANDPSALTWVWATLIDSVIVVHQQFAGGMSAGEADRFYRASRGFAMLFGLEPEDLPGDYSAFRAYVADRLSDGTLAVGPQARDLAAFLLKAPHPSARRVFAWYRVITSGLMPPSLRRGYALPWAARDRANYALSRRAIAAGYRLMPRSARYLPAYLDALERLHGRRPGRADGLAYRFATRGL